MTKKKLPVRFTGQHFTIDKVLIKDAIKQANITQQDTVLDIGAGKGFITVHLLKNVNKVVAIENDLVLYKHLCKRFNNAQNVQVVGCDFRKFTVPLLPFKVVSNIPYGITSDIFRILMFDNVELFWEVPLSFSQSLQKSWFQVRFIIHIRCFIILFMIWSSCTR